MHKKKDIVAYFQKNICNLIETQFLGTNVHGFSSHIHFT